MIMDANGEDYAASLRRQMDDGFAKMTVPELPEKNEATPLISA